MGFLPVASTGGPAGPCRPPAGNGLCVVVGMEMIVELRFQALPLVCRWLFYIIVIGDADDIEK